jgi:hypothetical protein
VTAYTPLIEYLANLIHESWMANQRKQGVTSAMSRNNTGELMIPYAELQPVDQLDDQRVVATVLLGLAGRPVTEVLRLLHDLSADPVLRAQLLEVALVDPPSADLVDRCADLATGEDGQQ